METKTYTTIDRAALGWPEGPWDQEPDKVQWPDPKTGLPCLAVRHPCNGFWCGYVGVAESHPLHGMDYDDVAVEVHGGLTFAEACSPGGAEDRGICHVPASGEPEHVWWFGFDCSHMHDFSPHDVQCAIERGYPYTVRGSDGSKYRTLDHVKQQCANLARQLKEQQT